MGIDLKKVSPIAIILFIMAWLFETYELGSNVSLADILPAFLFIVGGVIFFAVVGKIYLDLQKKND